MIILLDCDGVICDFVTPSLKLVAELGGPVLTHATCETDDLKTLLLHSEHAIAAFEQRVGAPGYCASLKPYEGALAFVDELRSIAEVACVTSPFRKSKTWMHERTEWLKAHFGFEDSDILPTKGKERVFGDAIIEDSVSHAARWYNASLQRHLHPSVLFMLQPWNKVGPFSPSITRDGRGQVIYHETYSQLLRSATTISKQRPWEMRR